MEPRTSGVWSTAQHGANATVVIPTRVCCAGAAASEVSLYTYISTLSGKPTNKCVMPVLSFAVISGGSRAGTYLSCLEFMIAPTAAGGFAKDIITDSEVHHMLKIGHQEDVRRDACNVGDKTDFAVSVHDNNEALLHGVS